MGLGMEPELRLLIGVVHVPVGALIGVATSVFFTGLVNYYARGLSVILRNLLGLSGGWSEGAARADGVSALARYASGACLWLAIWWAVFLYPDRRWVVEGFAALAFVGTVYVWVPAAFLREMFRDARFERRSATRLR